MKGGAYLVTADNGVMDGDLTFRRYANTFLIRPDASPKHVWHNLKILMENEFDD
jgi:hypothetical protein